MKDKQESKSQISNVRSFIPGKATVRLLFFFRLDLNRRMRQSPSPICLTQKSLSCLWAALGIQNHMWFHEVFNFLCSKEV